MADSSISLGVATFNADHLGEAPVALNGALTDVFLFNRVALKEHISRRNTFTYVVKHSRRRKHLTRYEWMTRINHGVATLATRSGSGYDSRLFFHITSHGYSNGIDSAILVPSYDESGNHALSVIELFGSLLGMPSVTFGTFIYFIDACQNMAPDNASLHTLPHPGSRQRRGKRSIEEVKSLCFVAAKFRRSAYQATIDGRPQSLFTKVVSEAFLGFAGSDEGWLTVGLLQNYLASRLPSLAARYKQDTQSYAMPKLGLLAQLDSDQHYRIAKVPTEKIQIHLKDLCPDSEFEILIHKGSYEPIKFTSDSSGTAIATLPRVPQFGLHDIALGSKATPSFFCADLVDPAVFYGVLK